MVYDYFKTLVIVIRAVPNYLAMWEARRVAIVDDLR